MIGADNSFTCACHVHHVLIPGWRKDAQLFTCPFFRRGKLEACKALGANYDRWMA